MYFWAIFVVFGDLVNCQIEFPSDSTCGELFTCADNATCVPESWVCDGHSDCSDGSDENYSACHDTPCDEDLKFRCDSGMCINKLWRCDGQADCRDESDEANCSDSVSECPDGELQCGDGTCITVEMRCNGISECDDGEDEQDCETNEVCGQSQASFLCDNSCIPDAWVCDGKMDCADKADERECYLCQPGETWNKDKAKCTALKPCQLAGCEQICDKGVCSCKQGYYLAEDQKSCITTHSPSLLALFQQSSGKATLVQHPTVQLWGLEDSAEHRVREMLKQLLSLENVQALDYHISLQKAVYADSELHSIMVTSLSKSSSKRSLQEVYHYGNTALSDIVVDWISDNIYWTNQTSHGVMVSNMDGSVVVELVKLESTPHHLTMDPVGGNLYWIGSVGTGSNIYTCTRSGQELRPLFRSQFHPASLAVDTTTGVLYWYDPLYRAIFSNQADGESDFSTIARNISHIENLNYFNGHLYWVSDVEGESELVNYSVTSREVASSHRLSRRPFKVLLFQEDAQRVYAPELFSCRNNRGGCSDMCFAGRNQEPRECGCVQGLNTLRMCLSENSVCDADYCSGDSWCSFSGNNQTCSCGHGYYGDQCQWTMCEDSCSMDTSCYQHSRSGLKYCCHDNARGCSGSPSQMIIQSVTGPEHNYDFTTMVTVGLAIAVTLGILAAAFGYRKWKKSRGRLRSNTLVDMYPMEPVRDELRIEDDEPLLYD